MSEASSYKNEHPAQIRSLIFIFY